MPHHTKPRLDGRLDGPVADAAVSVVVAHNAAATANELSVDVVAIIFGFFLPKDIMRMRRVSKKWREASKMTIVPPATFRVNSVNKIRAMAAMTTALPNLQQLHISDLGNGHKYSDGEDPDERTAEVTANFTTHDINIISNFRKLRVLHIENVYLNGRYPVLFDFPLLRKLTVKTIDHLKFDLGMLSAGCPSLKSLKLSVNQELAGNLSSLRVLKDTLEKVVIVNCLKIRGDFMDLADFPRLKKLNLRYTATTGDVRDIGEDDFSALESIGLPKSVRGGISYKFQHISEVPSFMQAVHLLMQRTPTLFSYCGQISDTFYWGLSEDSPDWYDYDNTSGCPLPPFFLQIIRAGSRLGWSWYSDDGDDYHSCEINWLDPEPSSESGDYETYIEMFQRHRIELNIDIYEGYSQPPNEDQYRRLLQP